MSSEIEIYSKTKSSINLSFDYEFHIQGFNLSLNPNNCWPNFKWFAVLFLQIWLPDIYVDS